MDDDVDIKEEFFAQDSIGIRIKEEECEDFMECAIDITKMEQNEQIYVWNSFAEESDPLDIPINRPSKPKPIPSWPHTVLETIMTRKRKNLTFNNGDGHLYIIDKRGPSKIYYACRQRKVRCPGRMTCDGVNVISTTPHNHSPPTESEVEKIRKEGANLRPQLGERPYVCDHCKDSFTSKRRVKVHIMRNHTGELIIPLEPSQMDSVCETIITRRSQNLTFNNGDGHLYIIDKRGPSRTYYACRQRKVRCPGRMTCDGVNVISTTPHNHSPPTESEVDKIRKEGIWRLGRGKKPFHCELSEKKFARESQLEAHMRNHRGEPTNSPQLQSGPSTVCETIMTRKRKNLTFNKADGHLYIINGRTPNRTYYACRRKIELGCTGRMTCDGDNVVMWTTPHNHSPPPESEVDKIRREGANLRPQLGKRPYVCDHCKDSFTSKRRVKVHIMRNHTGELIIPLEPSQMDSVCETIMTRKRRNVTFNTGDGHLYIINGRTPNRTYYVCRRKIKFGCPARMTCDGVNVISTTPHNHSPPPESEIDKIRTEGKRRLLNVETTFPCELCGKKFAKEHHLEAHMTTHNGEPINRLEPQIGPFLTVCETIMTRKRKNLTFNKADGHLYIINGRLRNRTYYACRRKIELGCPGKMTCDGVNVISTTPHNHSHPTESEIDKIRKEGANMGPKLGGRPFVCAHCNGSFISRRSLKYHLKDHNGEPINRPEPSPSQTDSVFETIITRKSRKLTFYKGDGHLYIINGRHPNRRYYACRYRLELGCTGRLTCDGDSFVVATTPHNHQRPSDSEIDQIRSGGHLRRKKRFQICKHCEASFTSRSNLKVHMRTHIGDLIKPEPGPSQTNSVCETILTRLKRKLTYNKGDGHLYNINGRSNNRLYYACTRYREIGCQGRMICEGDTVVSTTLHNHSRPPESEIERIRREGLRVGQKRHDCELCEANFTRKTTLKLHMRRHNGEKPYECRFCDAKFSFGHELREHRRIHPKEKPYECQDCKAKFISDKNLKKHLKTHGAGEHFLASCIVYH